MASIQEHAARVNVLGAANSRRPGRSQGGRPGCFRHTRQNKMIPRILVPIDARPPAAVDAPTQRRPLHGRSTLVPAMLPSCSWTGTPPFRESPLESMRRASSCPRCESEAYSVRKTIRRRCNRRPGRAHRRAGGRRTAGNELVSAACSGRPRRPNIFITGEVNLTVPEHKEERAKPGGKSPWRLLWLLPADYLDFVAIEAVPPHEPTQADVISRASN